MNENRIKSYFDGGLLGYIGINFFTAFFSIITFGLAFPWLYCLKMNWVTSHTVVEGKRLKFNGTGGDLILNWLKWLFFCIITFGIYSFWLVIKIKQWQVEHTTFDENFVY